MGGVNTMKRSILVYGMFEDTKDNLVYLKFYENKYTPNEPCYHLLPY